MILLISSALKLGSEMIETLAVNDSFVILLKTCEYLHQNIYEFDIVVMTQILKKQNIIQIRMEKDSATSL